jgi:hypothetical protein
MTKFQPTGDNQILQQLLNSQAYLLDIGLDDILIFNGILAE